MYRKGDRYFQRGPFLCPPGSEIGYGAHRLLAPHPGDIVKKMLSCGFSIVRVIEPEPPEYWRSMCPDRMDGARIPDFLVLLCQRNAPSGNERESYLPREH